MQSSLLLLIYSFTALSMALIPMPLLRFSRQFRRGIAPSDGTNPALINSLLTKAVSLSQIVMKEDNNKNNITSEESGKRLKPAVLSFRASHTQSIVMDDFNAAVAYLSLPASNYSVLNSNLVSRNPDAENIFELRLPLGGLSTASTYSSGSLPKLAAILQTSVKVEPVPEKRLVTMTSGPIFFTPTPAAIVVTNSSTTTTPSAPAEAQSTGKGKLTAALPEWLIWGGSDQQKVNINSQQDVTESAQSGNEFDSGLLFTDGDSATAGGIKASVQAGFELQLTWADKLSPPPDASAQSMPASDSLKVEAKIKVWVDMNLPLRSDLSAAINFPLVRVLLEQAGKLTTAGVLRTISPAFSELLVKDHDRRRGVVPKAVPRSGQLSEYTDSFLL